MLKLNLESSSTIHQFLYRHPTSIQQTPTRQFSYFFMLALAPQLGWHIDIFMYAFRFTR